MKYCIEDRGTRLSVTVEMMKRAHKEPQFTLLVGQSHEFVSRYFCSYKVYDTTVSRLEQKELFFISSSLITLNQPERYLPLIVLKGKVSHVYMYLQIACIYTWNTK
jgi:hypothetical protein